MFQRIVLFVGLIALASGCTHQVKLVSGITSVIVQKQGGASREGLAKQVKYEFYNVEPDSKGPAKSLKSTFPSSRILPFVRKGIAKALSISEGEMRVVAFSGDATKGFESAIESDDEACVTYYISDIGLQVNKTDKSIYRVSIGYQALTELQGDTASDENLAVLADAVTDSIRFAIVDAARRNDWVLSTAEQRRELKRKRKSYFPFGPDKIIAGPSPRVSSESSKGPVEKQDKKTSQK